jgi:hypothetical protein
MPVASLAFRPRGKLQESLHRRLILSSSPAAGWDVERLVNQGQLRPSRVASSPVDFLQMII